MVHGVHLETETIAIHMASHFLRPCNKEPKYFELRVDKIKLESATMQLGQHISLVFKHLIDPGTSLLRTFVKDIMVTAT